MNNPNEAILLTDQGHPIGEVVVADNSYEPPVPTEQSVAENREAVLKSVAADMTGDPANADKAVAEWYPGYADAEKRAVARDLFVAGSTIAEISAKVGVPDRTVAQWMYVNGWDRIVKNELAAQQTASGIELARIRATSRAGVAKRQLEASGVVRDKALEQLGNGGVSVKSAAEALKSAADVEARILGVSESGSLDDSASDAEQKNGKDGKQPLVVVFNGGLPPVRRHI